MTDRLPHRVWPLARPGAGGAEPVLVDGHPICAVCGAPAGAAGPDALTGPGAFGPGAFGPGGGGRWRHVTATAPWPPRSVTPITWPRLRRLDSYADFAARFGWAVRAAVPTTPEDWAVGMDRLGRYDRELHATSSTVDNPYLRLLGLLLGDPPIRPPTPGLARLMDIRTRRRELAARFAWAVPDESALTVLAALGPLVEAGAGTGYWAALLRDRGADVLAYDVAPPGGPVPNAYHPGRHTWTEVRPGDAVTAVRAHPDRTLLLCWPPFDDDAAGYQAVRAYRGEILAYVGDAPGGATGTPRLHQELALNWTPRSTTALPAWPGLADRLVVYGRNPRRRPLTGRDRCDECRRYVATGSIGRCDRCRERHPAALTLQVGAHRLEYPQEALAAMHPALAAALRHSVHRV